MKDMGKIKIFNDPVYGLIHIPYDLVFDIIEHPYFQRLRRIKQLGLTDLVYPGAQHTRFHHTIGALHLMSLALDNLKLKGISISNEEYEAALLAILLHDIGHGPFSHALEHSFISETSHEDVSIKFMEFFNKLHNGRLDLAIQVFKGTYSRKFLCQLVSGQLDVDRLDYLRRDSFYTGVSEGIIGSDRIIKMMNVVDDQLVIDEKGIYSIEKFLIARNLMYWQVYLHKTVLSAELMLENVLKRAKELMLNGFPLRASSSLLFFLSRENQSSGISEEDLKHFANIDDFDIVMALKEWAQSSDKVLAMLSQQLIDRKLFRLELKNRPFEEGVLQTVREKTKNQCDLLDTEIDFFVYAGNVSNTTYRESASSIKILQKTGELIEFSEASKQYDLNVLTSEVQKHYICSPKSVRLS